MWYFHYKDWVFEHPLVEGGRDDTRYYNDSGVKGLLGKYAASHSMSLVNRENPEHYRRTKSIILLKNIIIHSYSCQKNNNLYSALKKQQHIGIETISTEKLLVHITNNDEEKQATHWIKY